MKINLTKWEEDLQQTANDEPEGVESFISDVLNDTLPERRGEPLLQRLYLIDFVTKKYRVPFSKKITDELMRVGRNAYSGNDLPSAEKAFGILSNNGYTRGRTYYARMIRRGEVAEGAGHDPIDALRLLRRSMEEGDPIAFAEMALTLALCFGGEDWELADRIMRLLPREYIRAVERERGYGTTEQYLVHFLLLWHGKIFESELGDLEKLDDRLLHEVKGYFKYWREKFYVKTLPDEGAQIYRLGLHEELGYWAAAINGYEYIRIESFKVNDDTFYIMLNNNDPLDTVYCKKVEKSDGEYVRLLDLEREIWVISAYRHALFNGRSTDQIYIDDCDLGATT